MLFKKSISPLIATILLIVVSVILITVVLIWGSTFTKDNLNKATSTTDFKESDLSSFLTITNILQLSENNVITIRNLHSKEPITFIGYKLITKENYVFANQKLYFDEVITLEPGAITSLNLICFPENNFTLQLFDQDQTHFTLPIKINNYRSDSYCLGKDNVIAAYNMQLKENKLFNLLNSSRTGTVYGNVIKTNNGLLFNGIDSYIYFGNRIASESIQFKIKTTQSGERTIFAGVFKMYNFSDPINIMIFNGRIQFGFDTNNRIAADILINDGSWHTITITKTGITDQGIINMYKVFVDGFYISLVDNLGANRQSSYFLIGARHISSTYDLFGNFEMSDARFYNAPLKEQDAFNYHSVMTSPLE